MNFSFSFSRLKNFETCPLRHYELDLRKPKKYAEPENEQLKWGNFVHQQFAQAVKNGTPLPKEMEPYQRYLDKFRVGPGETLVEQKFALTKDLEPCEWFGPRAWCRVMVDFMRVNGPVAWALDWKTGKVANEESGQLMLTARVIFSFFPTVQRVKTTYVWLKEDCETSETYDRNTIATDWLAMLNRVQDYKTAFDANDFPPKPGKLCGQWCPVASCKNYRKRQ